MPQSALAAFTGLAASAYACLLLKYVESDSYLVTQFCSKTLNAFLYCQELGNKIVSDSGEYGSELLCRRIGCGKSYREHNKQ